MAFSYANNGDIIYNPDLDEPGEFVSMPFTFESDTREGWKKDGDSRIENKDLSIGIAESKALMFPAAFVPGEIEWADGVRLGSPYWPASELPLDACKNIGAVTMEVFLEDGGATTGELQVQFCPIPDGAGYWYSAGSVAFNPVSGGTVITNAEGTELRKYKLVQPFTIADYSEEVRVRNLIIPMYGDTDYSGNVYYDNIGFMTKDEYAAYLSSLNNSGNSGGSSSSGGSGSSNSGSGGSSTASNAPAPVNQAAAVSAVNQAVANAVKSGANTASITLKNVSDISMNTMKAIVKAAKGVALKLNADSMNGSSVDVRITIDPSNATKDINLSASTISQNAKNIKAKFEKYYTNNMSIISLAQRGDFGMQVEVAAKLDKNLDTKTLVFYSYDKATNTFKRIIGVAYRIDKNGYVHFTTALAGDIIITDKPLAKK